MEKIIINVYPKTNSWKKRLVVIFSTLFGLPYHHWVDKENLIKILKDKPKKGLETKKKLN